TSDGLARVIEAYRGLHHDFELPVPGDVFAVGYELPGGLGRSRRQIAQGLASCCPETLRTLGGRVPGVIDAFTRADHFERTPLATRFARWLATAFPEHEAVRRAGFEAAVATVSAPDTAELSLGWDGAEAATVGRAQGVLLAPAEDGGVVAVR